MKKFVLATCFIFFTQFSFAQNTYWWNDQVFYEIFVRSYSDNSNDGIGDFKGLIRKLDYLNDGNEATTTDLGITAIWLMPVMQSPSYHGYDVIDYKKIEQDYGSNQDFKDFLDSAHVRGIKVIIDLVLNHSSSNNPWFQSSRSDTNSPYRNWYRWSHTNPGTIGPWGQSVWHNSNGNYFYGIFNGSMPDLNFFEPQVKNEVANIVRYWLDTVQVDGFRLDAVKYICEEGIKLEDAPSTFAYWREFRSVIKSINPEAFSVGEAWSNTSLVLPYSDGTGLDICFEFETATDIINSINGGNPTALRDHMNNSVTTLYPFLQYGTFLTNHDQIRIFSQLGTNKSKAKLAASVLLTLPGVPFLYYGEEIGMTSGSDDPSKRTPMQWTPGLNAGFTTGTPWKQVNANYQTNNVETMTADSSSLLNHYKRLISIRTQSQALTKGKYFKFNSPNQNVYLFGRWYGSEIIIPILNFSSSATANINFTKSGFTGMPVGNYELTDLLTDTYVGQMLIKPNGDINCSPILTVAGYGSAILKADLITGIKEEENITGFSLQQNYPNPFNPSTRIEFNLSQSGKVKLSVFNLLGQEVKILVNEEMAKGSHSVEFNGNGLASGVYFYKLQFGTSSLIRKLIFQK